MVYAIKPTLYRLRAQFDSERTPGIAFLASLFYGVKEIQIAVFDNALKNAGYAARECYMTHVYVGRRTRFAPEYEPTVRQYDIPVWSSRWAESE